MNPRIHLVAGSLLSVTLVACASPASAPVQPSPPPPVAAPPAPAAPAATTAAPDPKVLGAWRIEQARSAPLIDKRAARLDFSTDGRLSGNASCNGMTASYTLAGDKLTIGKIATTRKACSEALMEQEDRVLTALERAARATVPPHGFLTLHDADGAVLMRASRFDAQ
jgi:heat shock protein HslJ